MALGSRVGVQPLAYWSVGGHLLCA
jgi:hypothetical protein